MEPVNLRPLMRTLLFLSKGPASENEIKESGFRTLRRTKKVMNMLNKLNLVSKVKNRYLLTDAGHEMCYSIRQNNWFLVDRYLTKNHSEYNRLKNIVIKWYEKGRKKGIPRDEIKNFEKRLLEDGSVDKVFIINDVILNFLIDWGERLEAVNENKLSKIPDLYVLSERQPTETEYNLLKTPYSQLAGKGLGEKYYLSIPLVREYSCEMLRISRSLFDLMLNRLHKEKPGCTHLMGAPETTITLKEARTIRQIRCLKNDVLEVNRSPIYGLKVNNSSYYYIHLEVDRL